MIFLGYIDPGSGMTVLGVGGGIIALLAGFFGFFLVFFKRILGFIKKHRKFAVIVAVLAIIFGVIITGVLMFKTESQFDKKVVILGFDGLSPKIIEPMMEKGLLPNFSHLKNFGSYTHLSTTNPPQSPVAWTGLATGKNPGKHGVFDFIVRDPKDYGLKLSLSNIDKGKPLRVMRSDCFWNYTSKEKIPTTVIACPVTFPPDKIYGRMLSGMGVPDILGTEGTFTFYTSERLSSNKDIGGKVFSVRKSPVMILNLIGPKVALGRKVENSKVPLKVKLGTDKRTIQVEYQNNKFDLELKKWSDWKEVTFSLGAFRKARGIFKFYLVEIEPEFKLYISPINFDPRSPFFKISYPADYSKELAGKIGLYYTQGMPMDTWAVNEKRLTEEPFLEQANEVLREKKAMLDYELARLEKGVLYCYFESPDIIQHMFWRYTDPEHPLYEKDAPARYKKVIEDWYKKMDSILGEVLKKVSDQDTLIVLSDHGFGTFRRSVHLNSWLRKNGYLKLKMSSAESGEELLVDIDWPETKAYSIGFGAIYINERGRESGGIVNPGRDKELLKKEISGKLKDLFDEKYSQKVINAVYPSEEIFWGEYQSKTPDLYVGFNEGYRASWQTAIGGVPKDLIEDNLKKWSGSHLFDPKLIPGVLFSNRKLSGKSPSLYDITPTILKACGFEESKLKELDFDGHSLLQ